MQIEVIKADSPTGLQSEVNQWLAKKKDNIEILEMVQSESRNADGRFWSMTLTLLYREKTGIAAQLAGKLSDI